MKSSVEGGDDSLTRPPSLETHKLPAFGPAVCYRHGKPQLHRRLGQLSYRGGLPFVRIVASGRTRGLLHLENTQVSMCPSHLVVVVVLSDNRKAQI